jgi:hypothetical protein
MGSEFFGIAEEGAWIWILFLGAAAGVYLLLAKQSSAALLSAILRTVQSVVVSPFEYLCKTASELALGNANPRLLDVDHYLLRRLLSVVQVGLLLVVVVGAGLAMTSAVVAFLPPRELRRELAENRDSIKLVEADLQQDSAKVQGQDSDWQNRRGQLIKEAQEQQQQKRAEVRSALSADQAGVKTLAGAQVLKTVMDFLAAHRGEYGTVEQAKSFINRIPSLDDSDTKALLSYCDHWQEWLAISNRAPKTSEELRAQVQPDHDGLVQKVTDETRRAKGLHSFAILLQEEVGKSYHPGQFVIRLVGFLLFLIPYVWAVGTAVEVFSFMI